MGPALAAQVQACVHRTTQPERLHAIGQVLDESIARNPDGWKLWLALQQTVQDEERS